MSNQSSPFKVTRSASGRHIHITPPRWVIYLGVLLVVSSWLPLAWIAMSRSQTSPKRGVHLFLDMDFQPKYTAQQTSPVFADGRAMRTPVEGTVARADAERPTLDDDHFYRGYTTDGNLAPVVAAAADGSQTLNYFDTLPESVTLDRALLDRGRDRYNIFCAVCHGRTGDGLGLVQQRVNLLTEADANSGVAGPNASVTGWAPARNLLDQPTRSYSVGRIFDVATRGFNTMAGYASEVPIQDRWAIAAYIKALQLSQSTPADQLPAELRP